jgi:hypothetical protein
MKCKYCKTRFNKHTETGGYIENKWFCNIHINDQPERSKREDLTTTSPLPKSLEKRLVGGWKRELLGCGALSSMET